MIVTWLALLITVATTVAQGKLDMLSLVALLLAVSSFMEVYRVIEKKSHKCCAILMGLLSILCAISLPFIGIYFCVVKKIFHFLNVPLT